MTPLRKIEVCQNTTCQDKGAKGVMQYLESRYEEKYKEAYPDLMIIDGDCMGDCEQGPIVKVNESMVLREATKEMMERLLENPEDVLGEVMHVLEQDREIFERIIDGELY